MAESLRFECASFSIRLKQLLKKARYMTTQLVKHQPWLTKPLEMKKRPLPKRRTMGRKMVSLKAKMQRDERPRDVLVAPVAGV